MPRSIPRLARLVPCALLPLFAAWATAAEPAPPPAEAMEVARGANAFACDLYRGLRTQPGNLVCSPASVHLVLGMLAAGADGATAEEFRRVLRMLPDEARHHAGAGALAARDAGGQLACAQRLYLAPDFTILDGFAGLCRDVYGAAAERTAFPDPGRTIINGWVAERTLQRIPELIPQGGVDASTALVAVNAVAFTGRWQQAFDPVRTAPGPFTVAAERSVTVPFMQRTLTAPVTTLPGATVVELAYTGDDVAMALVVPDAVDGLAAVETGLDADALTAALAQARPREVALALPRFALRWGTVDLAQHLQALGLRQAFAGADFSRLASEPVTLAHVFHQAMIAVDEAGTVAAAATAAVTKRSLPPSPLAIRADRPFLFLLRDTRTGAILFIGRVADPS